MKALRPGCRQGAYCRFRRIYSDERARRLPLRRKQRDGKRRKAGHFHRKEISLRKQKCRLPPMEWRQSTDQTQKV